MIKLDLPFCKVLMIERWNAPAGRYFIAYQSKHDFRHVLGLPVIDEFATFSSPIFFTHHTLIGKLYNAGISLGHKRDPEMGIDLGWPPLVVGSQGEEINLPDQWEEQLMDAIMEAEVPEEEAAGKQAPDLKSLKKQSDFEKTRIGECEIFATKVPLLPKQLRRICQQSNAPFSIAFSTGNRLTSQQKGASMKIKCASEAVLSDILQKFSKI